MMFKEEDMQHLKRISDFANEIVKFCYEAEQRGEVTSRESMTAVFLVTNRIAASPDHREDAAIASYLAQLIDSMCVNVPEETGQAFLDS